METPLLNYELITTEASTAENHWTRESCRQYTEHSTVTLDRSYQPNIGTLHTQPIHYKKENGNVYNPWYFVFIFVILIIFLRYFKLKLNPQVLSTMEYRCTCICLLHIHKSMHLYENLFCDHSSIIKSIKFEREYLFFKQILPKQYLSWFCLALDGNHEIFI